MLANVSGRELRNSHFYEEGQKSRYESLVAYQRTEKLQKLA